MKKYNYENLEVYKLAVRLVVEIYNLTKKFPKEEIFGLISQLRRAAVSVLLNIVEGSSRNSKKDFASFIDRMPIVDVKVFIVSGRFLPSSHK